MSIDTFCALQFEGKPISKWTLQRILDGSRPLDEQTEGLQLMKLVRACQAFQKSMPCEIAWRDDAITIRQILWKENSDAALAHAQHFVPEVR